MPRRIKKNISKEAEKKNKIKLSRKVKLTVRVGRTAGGKEKIKAEQDEIGINKSAALFDKNAPVGLEGRGLIEAAGDGFLADEALKHTGQKNRELKYKKREKNFGAEKRDQEKIEKDKMLILYSGVAFFMVLFAVIWAANFRIIFGANQPAGDAGAQLKEISGKFSDSIKNLKENIAAIKSEISSTTEQANIAGGNDADKNYGNVLPVNSDVINQDKIEILKEKLEKVD